MRGGGVRRLRWSGKPATLWEAFPRWVGAPELAHEEGRRVRQVGTDGAAGTEARCGRGGLPEEGNGGGTDKMNGRGLLL
jgi:hypothetical protein